MSSVRQVKVFQPPYLEPMATQHEILDSIPFFRVLNMSERENLAAAMERKTVSRHQPVFAEGDPASFFYILAEGSIKIGAHYGDGREIIKQILHPRMVFGEMALMDPQEPHRNFAIALSAFAVVYQIRVDRFRALMDGNPQVATGVISMIGMKLRQTERQLESLIFKDARARIIDFLLANAAACGRQVGFEILFKHSLTQQDIANYTGTSRQTVTAVLNDLRKQNKIYFTRSTVLIRDTDQLA